MSISSDNSINLGETKQTTPAAEQSAAAPVSKKTKSQSQSSSKSKRFVPAGVVHINATFNNTIISVSDTGGNVVSWSSAGANGFKGSRKSTPYAAQVTATKALETAVAIGLKTVSIELKGAGPGRESAVRAIAQTVNVTSIKDITPVPHNGTRPPKRRRV